MKKINRRHMQKYCDSATGNEIMNALNLKLGMEDELVAFWVHRGSGSYMYKNTLRHFHVKDALKVINELIETPYHTRNKEKFALYLDVLNKCLEDRIKYGDNIPDTTDGGMEEDNKFMQENHTDAKWKCKDNFKEKRINGIKRIRKQFRQFDWNKHLEAKAC